jgi:asparagine synthase (glutamine-hydrolysing)
MIDFVAQISFDGINQEKKLYLDTRSKNIPSPYSVKSYQDQKTQIKYCTSNINEFIKKTSDKKFLILAFICPEDRAKLRQILKIPDGDIKTDPELLLDLYLKHGEDQLKILSHGFVFIMVDYHNKTVKAFRDHIGIKNICYYQSDNTIYLSSSFKNLFKLSHLSHTLNQDKLNHFLKFNDVSPSDTFTNEIKKVPPMKALKFCEDKINIYKYSNYEINRSPVPHLNQIKGLKKLLMQSVAIEKFSNHSRIGFLFSGGIDSSTIISFFRKQKRAYEEIFSFSAQYKHIDQNIKHLIDESEFQNEILKLNDINGFPFNGEDESTLSNLEFYLEIIGQPFFFPNLYLTNRAFNIANENNVSIVMNGNDGDGVVSHGYEYLLELFFSLRWIRLYREINATSKTRQQSKRFIFNLIILKNISFHSFIKRSSRKKHLEVVLSNNHNKAIEIQTLLADHYGIEERYPFYNRDVIEYCINVSPELKNKNGQSRFILKEAIRGIVPEKIRTRTTKSNLGHALCIGYTNKDRAVIQEQFSEPHALIKDIIDIENLKKSWNSLLQNPRKYSTRSQIPSQIFSYTVLNKWLNMHFNESRN